MMKFIIPAACAAALAGIAAVVTMIVGAIKTAKTVVYLEDIKI